MKRATQITATALAALFAASPVAVLAQAEPAVPPVQEPAAPMAQEVTDAEIDAFAVAYESVIAIDAEYAPQLEQAAEPEARQLLLEEAQIAKANVVETTDGISVDRYVEILTMAQADPELTAQIVARLEQ
ncbi:DUF4168 domain-containing protein [Yoonia sp.]|uniref:DUF4168 domain-containing protein n=1 Tax=Yoonia sp. TaxID=2212373 RepID=UPI00391CDB94